MRKTYNKATSTKCGTALISERVCVGWHQDWFGLIYGWLASSQWSACWLHGQDGNSVYFDGQAASKIENDRINGMSNEYRAIEEHDPKLKLR